MPTKKRMTPSQKRIEELENRVEELEQELEDKNEKINKANEFKTSLKDFLGLNDSNDDCVSRDDVESMIDDALDDLSIDVEANINR